MDWNRILDEAKNNKKWKRVTISSKGSQSNSAYHRTNQPNWWASYNDKDGARKFLVLPVTRGDRKLIAVVDIPEGVTEVQIGAGKAGVGKPSDAHRETVKITKEEI